MLPGQTNLLDLLEARQRRDAGMSLASVAQGKRWSDIAYQAIEDIARRQVTVHIDDVLRAGIERPDHPNSWGAVWMRAIKNGIIQRSAETRPCTVDPGKHAHRYVVYFSRICEAKS